MIHPGSECFRFQLVTGKAPYTGVRDDDVNYLISNGLGPIEPRQFEAPGMTTAVWKIAKRCWHRQAGERPEVNAVLRSLERIADPGMYAHEPRSRPERETADL